MGHVSESSHLLVEMAEDGHHLLQDVVRAGQVEQVPIKRLSSEHAGPGAAASVGCRRCVEGHSSHLIRHFPDSSTLTTVLAVLKPML